MGNFEPANRKLIEHGKLSLGEGGSALDSAAAILNSAGLLDRSGGVLLSSEAALARAPIYFLGMNPGGTEEEGIVYPTLLDNLVAARLGASAWDDPEPWGSGKRSSPAGLAPMQKRFKSIAAFLKLDYRKIPASNLVFTRSRDVASHNNFEADRDLCRPVHELFLEEVQAEKLWIMGNTDNAAGILTDLKMVWRDARHAKWSIGHGTGTFCGRPLEICHTPHLSLWDPTGKDDLLAFAFGLENP